jgi:hypothetical protein
MTYVWRLFFGLSWVAEALSRKRPVVNRELIKRRRARSGTRRRESYLCRHVHAIAGWYCLGPAPMKRTIQMPAGPIIIRSRV